MALCWVCCRAEGRRRMVAPALDVIGKIAPVGVEKHQMGALALRRRT